jgi:hypothetical protein
LISTEPVAAVLFLPLAVVLAPWFCDDTVIFVLLNLDFLRITEPVLAVLFSPLAVVRALSLLELTSILVFLNVDFFKLIDPVEAVLFLPVACVTALLLVERTFKSGFGAEYAAVDAIANTLPNAITDIVFIFFTLDFVVLLSYLL